jgi:TetR/AcrR family transcriptional regulator, cholesterol catabolism regulator
MPRSNASKVEHPSTEGEPLSRRERKKERTRQEIYQAAMNLFVASGFDAVTIEDICRAADVAKGTFFLHFPTKDSLLLEHGRRITVELAEMLHEYRGDATSELREILRLWAKRAVGHLDVVRLMVREVMARPVTLADHRDQSRDLVHLLAAIIHRGQAQGEFRLGVEPRVAAAVVVSTYFAIVTEWASREGKFNLESALEKMLDVVLHGLIDRKSP